MGGQELREGGPARRLVARALATRPGRRLLDELVRLAGPPRALPAGPDSDDPDSVEHRRRIQAVLNVGDTLRIVYQPIVDLGTLRVVGYEALSRFASDRPPNEWYAEAHAVGLGIELEMLAISRAAAGPPPQGYLSVNVSPATLASDAFREFLDERMWGHLVVELTEHVGIDDYVSLGQTVGQLRARGGRLAVDDTGSGYASMRHVVSLGPDIIKLDRSLIASMDRDSGRRELARSLSRFARHTGASLVAEGIERPEEYDTCRQVGIDCGQGYLLGAPSPVEHLTSELRIALGPTA
jgi:EAL domain-containing protein (putative c-di-GMP-specific phosphodiesterase class I)